MNAPEPFDLEAPAAGPAPIDTAEQRLASWSTVAQGGAVNMLRVDGVLWSWDAHPRRQKNGALIGRCYAQRRGESPRDLGAYKIGADGRVLQLVDGLRGVLPGGLEAQASADVDVDEPGIMPAE